MSKVSKGRSNALSSGKSDSFREEFLAAGDRDEIATVVAKLSAAMDELGLSEHERRYVEVGRAAKKNYAQRLSTCIAQKVSDGLRDRYPTILPSADGKMHESRSMGAGGLKKLDVNYSTPELGLGLGISVKTINFRDLATKRYTKNVKRVDGELRAEAQDYHTRQPYSLLAGLVFMPMDAATDGVGERSSFRHAREVFAGRAGRAGPQDDPSRFERLWIGLYGTTPETLGDVRFFDVSGPEGDSVEVIRFSAVLDEIQSEFRTRNRK
ncbi:MAG: hypothetical protein A2623_02925 [Caulobacterales bacterium RIFCSPHIGHO2_01_FULL_70_19]|nr:MAG: hypothetical protein A2623_02925 [Caulobacterales bacterium RIFCSPHIGHO2_01_FULL_70_19]